MSRKTLCNSYDNDNDNDKERGDCEISVESKISSDFDDYQVPSDVSNLALDLVFI